MKPISIFKRDCLRCYYVCICKCIPVTTKRRILILFLIWSVSFIIYNATEGGSFLLKRKITFHFDENFTFEHNGQKWETVTGKKTKSSVNLPKRTIKSEILLSNQKVEEVRRENIGDKTTQNVIFIKTHKTGSSTVTNVMQRFAKSHNLYVALPKCEHRFCYPNKFNEGFLYEHKENETYNMLFNHAVFVKKEMLKIMNYNTKLVTIIREPYSQFDSTAQYFNYRKFYNLSSDSPVLDEFFKKSDESLKKIIQSADLSDGEGAFSSAKNPNAFDLGFDVWNETPDYIESVLHSLKQDFNLVMIMEYMEESLVLLKNELSWELEDVVFHVHNARMFKEKSTNDIKKIRKRILNWNKLDAAIYKFFNKTFWTKINNSPPGFKADVKRLKELNQHLLNYCTSYKMTALSNSLNKRYIEQTGGNLCADVLKEDIPFTSWFKIMRHFKIKRGFPRIY